MPVRSTWINTSLMPIFGGSISSSHNPASRLLFTNAFTYTTIATERMGPVAKRLLLFAATTGYQIRVFADAARRLGVDLTLATDRCHILEDPWGDRAIPVRFDHAVGSLEASLEALRGMPFDG